MTICAVISFLTGEASPSAALRRRLPPLRGVPRNAPNRCQPREGGVLLLFVEEDSPAERHADESQHRMSPLEKNVPNGNMFASSGISHANTITSLKCLLCETPPLRKETREGLWYVMLLLGTSEERLLLSPRDDSSLRASRNSVFLLNRKERLNSFLRSGQEKPASLSFSLIYQIHLIEQSPHRQNHHIPDIVVVTSTGHIFLLHQTFLPGDSNTQQAESIIRSCYCRTQQPSNPYNRRHYCHFFLED